MWKLIFIINFILPIVLSAWYLYEASLGIKDDKLAIKADLKTLGINANVIVMSNICVRILFKSLDDMNLYKMIGNYSDLTTYYRLQMRYGKLAYIKVWLDRLRIHLNINRNNIIWN